MTAKTSKHASNDSSSTADDVSGKDVVGEAEQPDDSSSVIADNTEKNDAVSPVREETPEISSQPINAGTICVRTILPYTTHVITDDDQIKQYDDIKRANVHLMVFNETSRIQVISTFVDQKANIYALANILPSATWGSFTPEGDFTRVLCNPITGAPITVWAIGHITRATFAINGTPSRQASVNLALLSERLSRQTANLLARLCDPPEAITSKGWADIRASKWQSPKPSEGRAADPILFTGVYDARQKLLSKQKMLPYSALDLKKNDLVLVEARINYYKSQVRNVWVSRAQLEFHAINLLHSAKITKADLESAEETPAEPDDSSI
ncbi:hypothetical protein BJ138DRAFT_1106719 [Hygrophoropsis aurantiaca]|uniref:Uncharacterized protein n=1 Tax=Hygrophoropsis aurantiaca TaxID=72124 RepID=A0ACB7ZTL6_9AGAM|nr:hypothetical protein BJ138DRAFT_1106719 [Hygrophoropsis aurantiaca]